MTDAETERLHEGMDKACRVGMATSILYMIEAGVQVPKIVALFVTLSAIQPRLIEDIVSLAPIFVARWSDTQKTRFEKLRKDLN